MSSNRSGTRIPERWTLSWRTVMIAYTMIEPRSDRVTVCSPQTQHHCYQVIRTTRVHQSSRSSKMVTVQERVVRSRLQLGYSTPTSFINRYLFIISTSPKSLTIYRIWWRIIIIDSLFVIERPNRMYHSAEIFVFASLNVTPKSIIKKLIFESP